MFAPELFANSAVAPEFNQTGGKRRGPKKGTKRKGKGKKGSRKRRRKSKHH